MSEEVKCRLVTGLFWGDEGKAKAVDYLGESAQVVARYQGGANAGHTVIVGDDKYVFHQVPSGIVRKDVTCVLGAGMVLDLPELIGEVDSLQRRGIDISNRIIVSNRAHIVTVLHKAIERIGERNSRIGTTLRGIGPTYTDKYSRRGIRIGDIGEGKNVRRKIEALIEFYRPIFDNAGEEPPSIDEIIEPILATATVISDISGDVSSFLTESLSSGKNVLIEGAQGGMLDIDWGTYPFVTSSSTSFSGVASGLGIDPRRIDEVVGVVKAFTTRVGNGPFPTEVSGEISKRLRGTGDNDWDEFGATTGRPRRCGWLDGNVLATNSRRWGVDRLFVTKMDVLCGIESVKICSAYKLDGKVLRAYPSTSERLDRVEPVYEEIDGWCDELLRASRFDELAPNVKYYVKRLEQLAGCPVGWISTGPRRDDIIDR